MTQVVARIPDDLADAIDDLVVAGAVESRSAAVRLGLERLVDDHRRAAVGAAIREGYRRQSQELDQVGWSDDATVAMISAEPW